MTPRVQSPTVSVSPCSTRKSGGTGRGPASAGWAAVFAPFALFYMGQPLKLDYLWAAFCMMGAVYFIFR